jgi:hypothetical protein
MTRTIWKYHLELTDEQTINMPVGAIPLCVGVQQGKPHLWVQVVSTNPLKPHIIRTYGTGHPIDTETLNEYLGTYLIMEDSFVGHVFLIR